MTTNHLDERLEIATSPLEAPETGRDSTIVGPVSSSPGRDLVERLAARGVRFRLSGNRPQIENDGWNLLTPEDQWIWRTYREEIRAFLQYRTVTSGTQPVSVTPEPQAAQLAAASLTPDAQAEQPAAQADAAQADASPVTEQMDERGSPNRPRPEMHLVERPVLKVNGRPVPEAEIEEHLGRMGDRTLADYRAGRLTPRRAQELVASGLRQMSSMNARGDRVTLDYVQAPSADLAPDTRYDPNRVARNILRVTDYVLKPNRRLTVPPEVRDAALKAREEGDAEAVALVLDFFTTRSVSKPVLIAAYSLERESMLHIIARDHIVIRARLKQLTGGMS